MPSAPERAKVDVTPEIAQLGAAWRAAPADPAPLQKLVELARANKQWRPAVPFIAESLASTDVAIDAAFDAVLALGAEDPKVTVALFTAFAPRVWGESKISYERYAKAHARAGRALIPAYLAAAKLVDVPAIRQMALTWLGRWHVAAARPMFLEILDTEPYLKRDAQGGMSDPRGMLHLTALGGLAALGRDAEAANAMFRYAFDPRMKDASAHDALDYLPEILDAPSPVQLATLLEHAIDPKKFADAERCGAAYALLVSTTAELEQLARAPAPDEPYFSGYAGQIESVKRVFACEGQRPCLLALLETVADRQYDTPMLERAVRELARAPAPDVIPTLVAIIDEASVASGITSSQQLEYIAKRIPRLVPGPCPRCIAHLESALARHEDDSGWRWMWNTDLALDELRARQAPGAVIPAAAPARDAFAAIVAAEHVALVTQKWDMTVFAPNVFAIGHAPAEVGAGVNALAAALATDFGKRTGFDGAVRSYRGVRGRVMWDAQLLTFPEPSAFAFVTQLVVEEGGVYRVRAWSSGLAADDRTKPPLPAAIADHHGDAELEAVARAVLTSRPAWVKAMSAREDAILLGNDHTDEWRGPAGKAAFARLGGAFKLRDGVHVEKVSDDVGFAAANVDYLGKPYRVLAVFLKEPAGWKIIQSHWSFATR